jgi:hypothetical protein
VDITRYGVVLFLHIGIAIIAFMMAAVVHAAMHAMPRSASVAQARPFARLVHRLDPLLPIAALLLLGLGAWLIHLSDGVWKWKDGWILVAVISLVVVEGLAGALLAPRAKKLVAMIEAAPDGELTPELRKAMADPVIWDLAHVATLGFLGVVFVMAAKPSGVAAAAIVIIGAITGVALSRWQLAMIKVDAAKAVIGH